MKLPRPKKIIISLLLSLIFAAVKTSADEKNKDIKKIEDTTIEEIIRDHDEREKKYIKIITQFYSYQESADWKNALSLCSNRVNKAAEYVNREEFEARFVIDSFYFAKNKIVAPKISNAFHYHNRTSRVSGSVFMIKGENDTGSYYVTIITENNQFVIDNFFPSKFPAIFSF